jgi:hypothetical protein
MPYCNDTDVSYPVNLEYATDFFYRIDTEKQWPWVISIRTTPTVGAVGHDLC